MESCIFCDKEKIKADIVHETENFHVKVGFGLYAPGQVMLIPKAHYGCFGDIPPSFDEEHSRIHNLLIRTISNHFSSPFEIEMGLWGQSVHHAHTHYVPSKGPEYEIKDIIEEMVKSGDRVINYEETDRAGLREIYAREGAYVSIEQRGKLYVCHVSAMTFDPENPDPQITLRGFFPKIGVIGVSGWRNLSPEDKKRDEARRDLTKRVLTF